MDDFQTRLEQLVNAAVIYQRDVSKIRAERDALAEVVEVARGVINADRLDNRIITERRLEDLEEALAALDNAQPHVGGASAPPIETAADPWDEEWQAWQSVCALLRETGAVTEADCKSWEGAEPTTIGQRLFEAIRAWGLASTRVGGAARAEAAGLVAEINYRDAGVIEAAEDLLADLRPRRVHIGHACDRYEATYSAHKSNPVERLRARIAEAKLGRPVDEHAEGGPE